MNYTPTEKDECITLAEYLDILQTQGKILVYSHTAQSTWTRSIQQKMKNKRMGVRPGVPDYIVVTPTKVLFLEMKRTKGGRLSDEQKVWLEALEGKECVTAVCKGFNEAEEVIERLEEK